MSCSGTRCGKATTNPFPHIVTSDVICGDDDHSVNAIGIQPILSDAKCGCCGSTGEVDDGVRPSDTGILGELGMTHSKSLEQITTIKPAFTIVTVVFGMFQRHLEAWETRCKHNPGPVACVLWHLPVANKTKPSFADLFNRRQWDCCVSKSEKTSSHTQLSGDVPSKNHLRVNTKLFCKVKRSFHPSKLWHVPEFCGLVHIH